MMASGFIIKLNDSSLVNVFGADYLLTHPGCLTRNGYSLRVLNAYR